MTKRASILLLTVLALAAVPNAVASILIHLTLAEMTEQSSAILLGRCVEVKGVRTSDGEIVTQNVFEVREYYKGNLGPRVTITEPGGQVGNLVEEYTGIPQFQAGEESVLFVWTSPRGRHQVIGLTQGKFRVRRDSQTGDLLLRQTAPAEPMLEPPSHSHSQSVAPLSFSLMSFHGQIAVLMERAAAQKRGGAKQ